MNQHRFGSVRFGFGFGFGVLVWFGLAEMKFSDVADDCMPRKTEDGRTENWGSGERRTENGKPRTGDKGKGDRETTQNKLKECTKSRRRSVLATNQSET